MILLAKQKSAVKYKYNISAGWYGSIQNGEKEKAEKKPSEEKEETSQTSTK